jgi:hypothetical protein
MQIESKEALCILYVFGQDLFHGADGLEKEELQLVKRIKENFPEFNDIAESVLERE